MLARDVLSGPVITLSLDVPAHTAAGLLVVAAEHRVDRPWPDRRHRGTVKV